MRSWWTQHRCFTWAQHKTFLKAHNLFLLALLVLSLHLRIWNLNICYLFVLIDYTKQFFIHIFHGKYLIMLFFLCAQIALRAGELNTVCHSLGKIAMICSFNGPAMQTIVYLLHLAFPMDHYHESSPDLWWAHIIHSKLNQWILIFSIWELKVSLKVGLCIW